MPTRADLREPGWRILPLRLFLGLTFTFASLQKLADPNYLDPSKPTSVAHQMLLLRHHSPIGPVLGLSAHAPTLTGLSIAIAELAVGLGTLLGLWARLSAVGGALLALTFFLTVSWSTRPYYYGSDIVFIFAWSVLIAFGAGGVLSIDGWLRKRSRVEFGLPPHPVADEQLPSSVKQALDRRTVVNGSVVVGGVGLLAAMLGGMTAAVGRAAKSTGRRTGSVESPGPVPSVATSPSTSTAIAQASSVPVGQGVRFFHDGPAWLVHKDPSTFVAFTAVCTHAGCTVAYDSTVREFLCPCHGGSYDATTGQVISGPPPAPLRAIPVRVVGDQVVAE